MIPGLFTLTSDSCKIAGYCGDVAFGGRYPVPVSFTIILTTTPSLISVFKTAPFPLRHGSTTVTNGGVYIQIHH